MVVKSSIDTMTGDGPVFGVNSLSPTAAFRRTALAAALFVAPWGIVLGNLVYAWETRHGGSDDTAAAALALTRAHPALDRFAMVVTMLGALLMVPATIGAMRLIHRRAARLGLIGGGLMAAGCIGYFAMLFSDRVQLVMAGRGGNQDDYARILDDSLNGASVIWVYLTFLIGNLVGTFLLGLALRRSRAVPAWVGWGVLGWPILHLVGMVFGSEWFEVAGALAQVAGLAGVAIYLRRLPLGAEPDPAVVRLPRAARRSAVPTVPPV
jgi:hypothetical protein